MLDTLSAAKELKKVGIPEEQAESIIHVIIQNNDDQINKLATKENLKDVHMELKQDISNVRNELKEDISNVRAELKEDISQVKQQILQIRWQMILAMAGLLAIFKGLDSFF